MRRFLLHLLTLAVLGWGTGVYAQTQKQKELKEDQKELGNAQKVLAQALAELTADKDSCEDGNKAACKDLTEDSKDIAKDKTNISNILKDIKADPK